DYYCALWHSSAIWVF
nr:immunoglobulin light chain junction region [Macaca mulatta]MOV69731.1 immunoglobulin light chain junction region [Macaca mulatta]